MYILLNLTYSELYRIRPQDMDWEAKEVLVLGTKTDKPSILQPERCRQEADHRHETPLRDDRHSHCCLRNSCVQTQS